MKKYIHKLIENVKNFRFNKAEISGSLGDLGLYIPLVTALVTINGLSITSVLFFSGLFNILSGVIFGIPICVQPMKAIATIAIAEGLTHHQILAAGIIIAIVFFMLGYSKIIKRIIPLIPKSIIRGIQVALGLKLLIKGLEMIKGSESLWGYDSILIGGICIVLITLFFAEKRVPAALIIFSGGLLLAILKTPQIITHLDFNISWPHLISFSKSDFLIGGFSAALPQIPLTLLNSVISVCALSKDLFPKNKADEQEVAISVGLMNLIGCLFGGMPVCHGASGLAGQYRYGARTGGSMVFLGSAKMLLGIFFGVTLIPFLLAFPKSVLGALLFFAGMELALLIKDIHTKRDLFIIFATISAIIVFNTLVGFIIGLFCFYIVPLNWLNSQTDAFLKEQYRITKNLGEANEA